MTNEKKPGEGKSETPDEKKPKAPTKTTVDGKPYVAIEGGGATVLLPELEKDLDVN